MEFPFEPYHYRFNCPNQKTDFTANDFVCAHCICYVCKVSLMHACRTRSHTYAAPPSGCDWNAWRLQVSAEAIARPSAKSLLITLKVPIQLHPEEIYQRFGVPVDLLKEYLSDFCGSHLWKLLSTADLFTREVRQNEIFSSISSICNNVRANPAWVAHMVRHVPETNTDRQFEVFFKLHDNRRLDAFVCATTDDCLLSYSSAKALHSLSDIAKSVSFSVVTWHPRSERVLFPHQRLSLSRMLHVERFGMTDFMFRRTNADKDKGTLFICPNLMLLTISRQMIPDANIYGGLLCNDRGSGKTFVVASLIQACQASEGWMQEVDVATPPVPAVAAVNEPAAAATGMTDTNDGDDDDDDEDVMMVEPDAPDPDTWHDVPLPRCKATLVIVPKLMLLEQWLHELSLLSLRTFVYNGKKKDVDVHAYDVILTTTDVLRNSVARDVRDSFFCKVHFWRVIMDECHKLFQGVQLNKTGKALERVRARNRWGMTATPELGTPARCRQYLQLLYGTPTAQSAQNNSLHYYGFYSRRTDDNARGHLTAAFVKSAICVNDAVQGNVMPVVHFHNHVIPVSPEWLAKYKVFFDASVDVVDRLSTMHKLVLLNRFLSVTAGSHPMPLPTGSMFKHATDENAPVVPADVAECCICLGDLCAPVRSTCHHYFCEPCIVQWRGTGRNNCPLCRAVMGADVRCQEFHDVETANVVLEKNADKMVYLVNLVFDLLQAAPTNRILLFSRYPKVRQQLHDMLDGVATRTQVVSTFQENPEYRVLILSPQSCGVGLNLMQANHVILAEPAFRKSHEEQAYGRAARIGQTQEVHVHHVAVGETMEARLLTRAHNDIHELFLK